MDKPKKASLLDRLDHAARMADEDNPNWLSPHIREAAAEIVRLQALLAAPSPSATGNGGVDERDAFELTERNRPGFGEDTLTRYVSEHFEYALPLVQARWEGWQARAALAAPSLGIDAPEQVPEGDVPRAALHRTIEMLLGRLDERSQHPCSEGLDYAYRLIADDAYALTFQTFGQYRTALLKALRTHAAAQQGDGDANQA